MKISQMLNHPWIKNMATEAVDNSKQLDMSNNLAIFAKTTSFQSGICSILANMLSHSNDLRDLNKMFVQWDTSQDGYLSYEELSQNMTQITGHFGMNEPDVLKLMKAADTNGDGSVDYQEFVTAAFNKEKLINEKNLKAIFKMFDQDGDGSISPAELKAAFGGGNGNDTKSEEVWNEVLDSVDKDNDGVISY